MVTEILVSKAVQAIEQGRSQDAQAEEDSDRFEYDFTGKAHERSFVIFLFIFLVLLSFVFFCLISFVSLFTLFLILPSPLVPPR